MSEKPLKEDIEKVAKGTGATLAGTAFGKTLFFISQIVIARLLGVEEFGLYSLGLAAVKICEIFARLGLNTGGMRFVSIYKDQDPHQLKGVIISATGISLLSGFLMAVAVYFLSDTLAQTFFQKPHLTPVLRVMACSIPFVAGMMVVSSLLQGFHTTKYTMYAREILQPAVNLPLVILFYLAGLGLQGAVYAFILSNLAALLAGVYYCRRMFPALFSRTLQPSYNIRPLLSYSFPLLFVGFLHFFLSSADILMLGFLSSTREVGIYKAASQISAVMSVFLIATNSIYAPLAADLFQRSEMVRLANVFKTTTRWVSYATIPIFILLTFAGYEIMLIFGKEYADSNSTVALSLLAFGHLVSCLTGGVGITLTMTQRQKLELFNSICMVAMNLTLNYLLIPKHGAIGAAFASSASIVAINLIRLGQVGLLYRMHPFTLQILKYMTPTVLSVVVLSICYEVHFAVRSFTSLLIKSSVILLLFSVFFLKSRWMTEEDDIVWKKISGKFKKGGA